jgi:hypothetical protein
MYITDPVGRTRDVRPDGSIAVGAVIFASGATDVA